ncbi:Sigma-54 interaction domain-containing protein [Desulfonema limicola]|uniref:Sigma-54 interaction domain-containing protein n=1 Tax=Desulfonema limicola TaxID=45656 RepID=A0A975BAI6_9BACT|nr:RNA repair transcriptional activator RtcR family protein [Desulfonema limicola]QTA81760.1 Sigma-54 interaction domain-containing protein [Desulfonema limicola]
MKNQVNHILLTFNGFQDPYNKNGKIGPILSILENWDSNWQKIIIFYTPDMKAKADETCALIREKSPETIAQPVQLSLEDPTDYESILRELRQHYVKLREDAAQYYIAAASGSSQMHACWLMLTASGEINARILHIKEERFRKQGESLIREINPRTSELPKVRSLVTMEALPEISAKDIENARKESGLIGSHPEFLKAVDLAVRAAQTDIPILLSGKTGTGKELFAEFIQKVSKRRDKQFIIVNCAAISESLIESELFGHKKGAFTGADKDKKGKLEIADSGTVFLDEIGEISPNIQAKMLRFIQEGEIQKVGEEGNSKKVDVRIIAATNKNLKQAVSQGSFREDLLYRLTFPIFLPSLNDRRSDIPLLVDYFLEKFNKDHNKNKSFAQDTLIVLQDFKWKGNVRELSGIVERTVISSRSQIIQPHDLNLGLSVPGTSSPSPALPDIYEGFKLEDYIKDIRRQFYEKAYEKSSRNKSAGARLLGVTSQCFGKQLKEYKII